MLDPAGYCDGCFRTGDEIAAWQSMSETERFHLMAVVLPAREAHAIQGPSVQGASA